MLRRNLIVIKSSLMFKRYYSNSNKLNNNNNINNKGNSTRLNISNPLNKSKTMVVYIDIEVNKKIILEENKGRPGSKISKFRLFLP